MNAETELKFQLSPRKLSSVLPDDASRQRRRDTSRHTLVSTYFDTPKRKLRRHGLTLRVREVDGQFVQTVKAGAPAA